MAIDVIKEFKDFSKAIIQNLFEPKLTVPGNEKKQVIAKNWSCISFFLKNETQKTKKREKESEKCE